MSLRPSSSSMLFLACSLLVGCGSRDDDGDGLSNAFEARIGTDASAADSDGDGCNDAVEVLTHFSPLDAADLPYEGGYPRGPRPGPEVFDALATEHGEGYSNGSLNPNWTLIDRHGAEVELWDFYGQVVMIDIAAEWCNPCKDAAPEAQDFYERNRDEGFVILQLLYEGIANTAEPDAARWADVFDLEFPVLADHSPGGRTETQVVNHYIPIPEGQQFGLPNVTILDRSLRIEDLYVVGAQLPLGPLTRLLQEEPPEVDVALPDNAEELRALWGISADSWVADDVICR